MNVRELAQAARDASAALAQADTRTKNAALAAIAVSLREGTAELLAENEKDLAAAKAAGMTPSLLDRLALTPERIEAMAAGTEQVASLPDPIGQETARTVRPDGLEIRTVRVPLGVVGMIYEARPNVTVDAAVLCLKSGNACVLRGGKEAIRSGAALARRMRRAIGSVGLPETAVAFVEDPTRDSAREMMALRGVIDVLIPRGGAGLIQTVVREAKVPVIETGVGNCHVYVDRAADPEMAAQILINAKCSRPSVCNAAESLLVHRDAARAFLPLVWPRLRERGVTLYGCEATRALLGPEVLPAGEEEYAREFLDYALSCQVVDSLDEALAHIARYGTGHSEAIVTADPAAAETFLRRVDAAAVYWNASTRFTDGGEFGLGAEIGISTQKLHARGPMGLTALTSTKYVVRGTGQIR